MYVYYIYRPYQKSHALWGSPRARLRNRPAIITWQVKPAATRYLLGVNLVDSCPFITYFNLFLISLSLPSFGDGHFSMSFVTSPYLKANDSTWQHLKNTIDTWQSLLHTKGRPGRQWMGKTPSLASLPLPAAHDLSSRVRWLEVLPSPLALWTDHKTNKYYTDYTRICWWFWWGVKEYKSLRHSENIRADGKGPPPPLSRGLQSLDTCCLLG